MKAINYRGQNDFYLFDKPEEPRYCSDFSKARRLACDELSQCTCIREKELRQNTPKANLSAGKKIINPEVLEDELDIYLDEVNEWRNSNCDLLKPGYIFPLPENIGFEEDVMQNAFLMATACVRLLVKDEDGAMKLLTALQVKEESQDELWNEIASNFRRFYEEHAIEESKSKFTITRKP